ncbi:4Fe-4S binding protein [Oscillibacter sp.]|uniref:nucleotide-binding protein n=1 Tax=Oscillibacter sp. TaxID=1945593 RepID=UPI0028AD666C|nr:4Fe-4S binding protein [Oscillibacter sp.]
MKKLLILSGKGGTGKTTTAAAFIRFADAHAYADCDVDAPNLHLVTTMSSEPEYFDYLGSQKAVIDPAKCLGCGKCAAVCRFDAIRKTDRGFSIDKFSCEGCGVCAAVCQGTAISLLDDVAGEVTLYRDQAVFATAELKMGRGNSGKLVSEVKLALANAARGEELAIIDGSPGIGCPVIASMSGVDLVLIVAEPSLSGRSDLERILKTAEIFQTKTAVCVNKYDSSPENTEKIEQFCTQRGIPFAGRIPYDRQASAAINSGKSLADIDCPASRALREVFERTMDLLGGDTR